MNSLKSVEELCGLQGLALPDLAARSGLEETRIRSIVEGRWTPSPAERDKIATALGLTRDQIAWGHRTTVQHLQGHGPQFGRSP